jgi:ABC-type sugar transport system ATPase subunit
VVDDGGERVVQAAGGTLRVAPDVAQRLGQQGTGAVRVGVRPEHLVVAGSGIPAKLRVVESLGHERHLLCELQDAREVIVRTASGRQAPAEGTTVFLDAPPESLHLFDPDSGRRLD